MLGLDAQQVGQIARSSPAVVGVTCQLGGGTAACSPCCVTEAPHSHVYTAQTYG